MGDRRGRSCALPQSVSAMAQSGSVIDQLDYRSAALSMFGSQVTSGRKSSPVYGMGTGYHNQKVFISQEHEKCNFGRVGPGPAHYNQKNVWKEWVAFSSPRKL